MRLLLQGLVLLSTAAAPQPRSVRNVEVPPSAAVQARAPVQAKSTASRGARQVSLLEEKRTRLQAVEKRLDSILEDVAQMKPEEI
jgi:hypothetical protein